jgi:hypothetical protein
LVVTNKTMLLGHISAALLDTDEFQHHDHQVIYFITDYYTDTGSYPVRPSVTPGFQRDIIDGGADGDGSGATLYVEQVLAFSIFCGLNF